MQIAYRAANLPEASLIADLLAAAGIEVRVFNQHAQSAVGEIPPLVAGPQVWVMDDGLLARARGVIADYHAQPAPGNRPCRRCGEDNPDNFLTCWSCAGWL